jgi:serine/threonine protein kinase
MSTDAFARKLVAEIPAATDAEASPSGGKHVDKAWIYLAGFGSALLLVIVVSVAAIAYFRYKRRSTAVSPWKQGMSGQLQRVFDTTAPLLKREEVEVACEDFSNIIGQSSDNVMYKGTLPNGTEIAATSMRVSVENWSTQKELSFRRKVEALARMKHRHLVNLVGYSSEEEPFTRILVFEYASNGTLHDHLHNKESEHLDWATRMRIAMGAALGLSYMHHELLPPASHLNLDSSSIFLTDDYAAKVANFAVSKMSMTTTARGQKSTWLTPRVDHDSETLSDRHSPDFESNIFSFGVLLLEVISGRVPQSELTGNLVDWANEYLSDPKMVWYMIDPSLKTYNHDELVSLCKIVSLCLASRNRRPSMRKVTSMLAEALKLSPESVGPKSTALLWAQLELNDDTSDQQC